MMKDSRDGSTHWDGCWRDPEHWECAVAWVEKLRADLASERERCERLSIGNDALTAEKAEEREYAVQFRDERDRLLKAVSRVCDPGSPDEYNEALANLARLFESMSPTATVHAVPEQIITMRNGSTIAVGPVADNDRLVSTEPTVPEPPK